MLVKQIYIFGFLSTTCFGALRLLNDIGNFKRDLITFLLPPSPSQDLKHPSTQRPDTGTGHTDSPHFCRDRFSSNCLNLENDGWRPMTDTSSQHQYQEVQEFIRPKPDLPQQTTTPQSTLSSEAEEEKTLYREDLLNRGKLHDKKQRVGSGNCIGNEFCSDPDSVES